MGGERTGKRKCLYLCIACLILLTSYGCVSSEKTRERVEVEVNRLRPGEERKAAKPVATEAPRVAELPPAEVSPPGHAPLHRARKLLSQGDYEGSLREAEKALSLAAGKSPADEALFSMGLVFAHSGNPKKDYGKAVGFLKRVMKEYPQSPWAEEAKVLLALIQENENLSQMIEKSKQVDIEIEEKKRKRSK